MKKKFNILYLVIFTIFCLFFTTTKVDAASWSITASKSNVDPGKSFTVSIRGNVAGVFSVRADGGQVSATSVGKNSLTDVASFSVTADYGTAVTVYVSGTNITDSNYNMVYGTSDSVTVYINSGTNKGGSSSSYGGDGARSNSSVAKKGGSANSSSSSRDNKNNSDNDSGDEQNGNNNLKSLTVDGFKLSPEFKSDVTEYTVEVGEEIEKININAEAEDGGATVDGLGEKDLSSSDTFQVAVTAPNGQVKTYTIKVVYKDDNPIKVKKGKRIYTVVKRKNLIKEFGDYKFTTIKIKNFDIPALYNKTTKLTLVGLKYKDKVYLYRYNKKKNSYVRYIEFKFNDIKLVLFKPSKKIIPDGYKKYTIKIGKHKINAYKLSSISKYSLLYGMNIKNGKKSLYFYDEGEKTIQRYNKESLNNLIKEVEQYQKLSIILGCIVGLLVIVVIILVVMIVRLKKKNVLKNISTSNSKSKKHHKKIK